MEKPKKKYPTNDVVANTKQPQVGEDMSVITRF